MTKALLVFLEDGEDGIDSVSPFGGPVTGLKVCLASAPYCFVEG